MNRRSGILCAAAALVPLVLTGCGPSPAGGTGPDVAAGARPAGQSWIVVATGAARPAPSASSASSASPASPSPSAKAEAPPRAVPAPPSPKPGVRPKEQDCVKSHPLGRIEIATVRLGRTNATVGWYHPGDSSVIAYRVAALSQELVVGRQPELTWTVVKPGVGCHEMTADVSGLRPGHAYVFVVNAVRMRLSQVSAYNVTVARSRAVMTDG
ncbi:fibronectin type III domain-containing protein [Actinoplanes sp. NPDC026623]|uniref:fibronectin type III domain-containing protein n=1 Tax=Actinoplanes sp. NPDC026623 TaxID=3155610 RepID=UPI0033ECA5B8